MLVRVATVLVMGVFGVGCATTEDELGDGEVRHQPDAKTSGEVLGRPDVRKERLLGRVTAVHEEAGFVIIQSVVGRVRLDTGTPLEARGVDGVLTPLRFSPEQKSHLLCADFDESAPRIGDFVFQLPQVEIEDLGDTFAVEDLVPPPL